MADAENTTLINDLISKFGLPTALLLVCGYFIYGDIVRPLANNYRELLLEVKANNTEIRKGILDIGEENRKRISKIEDQILNNTNMIGTGLEKIAEANQQELARIEAKIDRLLGK